MSQAPSVAFAVVPEETLVGVAASLSGGSPESGQAEGSPASRREPQRDLPPGEGSSPTIAEADRPKDTISLRGTTRGLEILVSGTPSTAELRTRLTELLAEAPGFFAGSNARVAIEGALPSGALGCIEDIATRFGVRIIEIGPVSAKRRRREPAAAQPANRVEASGPIAGEVVEVREPDASAALPTLPADSPSSPGPTLRDSAVPSAVPAAVSTASASTAVPRAIPAASSTAFASAATALAAELAMAVPPGARLVVGPVRSGVIVDHPGHVIVIGDVNPCAEVRAEGSIIVLGRMRGVAHAAIGRTAGFIIALSLQPQQLRIGRMVARAADADRPSGGAEIAYATGETIVVERFSGRLPSGLAASM